MATLDTGQPIDALIDSRRVQMVLVIDRRFTRDLLTHQPAPVQLILDGRNSNTALLIEGYANTILNDFALAWTASHGEPAPPAELDVRTRYNPTLVSRWFIVPGIVALLTQVVTLLVVGLSVAREREMGTFDQLLVTPLRQIDILLGKGLPGLLIGVVEASVIIAAAVFWFHVPLRGGLGAALSRARAVRSRRHRHRARDLLARGDAAAGAARRVPVHGAVDHPVRLRHADRQHARLGAGSDADQSDALLPGDRARRVPARGGRLRSRLAILADGGDRPRHSGRGGLAVPQTGDVTSRSDGDGST